MSYSVALIGAGIIASEHLQAIKNVNNLHAIAVADIDEGKVAKVKQAYDLVGYLDYQEMIVKEKPDIVVISLPHYLHKDVAIYCARNGCHMLLEKPMALNTQECDDIIRAASHYNVQVMIGHTQHYFSENELAKQIIHEGSLGRLVQIHETRHMKYFTPQRPEWFLDKAKAGGGIMMNLGAHSVDKIQWLLDTSFTKVLAHISFYSQDIGVESDVEGSGHVYLETDTGIPVTVSISGYEGVPKQVTELCFTKGMLKIELGKGVFVSRGNDYTSVPLDDQKRPFEKQFLELLDAIHKKKPLENSGVYGRSVIHVIQAIYHSHEQGRMVEI